MQNNCRDNYGITVKGEYGRSILPEKVVDVGRFDVRIEKGGVIEGGALCTNVEGRQTPFFIDGSLLALGSVQFEAAAAGVGSVHGPVMVNESLVMDGNGRADTAFRVVGDISAKKINLKNAVVYGNVIGNNVTLTNCLVLGVVNAASLLKLRNSLVFTFFANEAEINDKVLLLNCSAAVTRKLSVKGQVFTLAFNLWDSTDQRRGLLVKLDSKDIKTVDCERGDGQKERRHIFSCYDRVVDVSKLGTTAAQNINWIEDRLIRLVEDRSGEIAQEIEGVFYRLFERE